MLDWLYNQYGKTNGWLSHLMEEWCLDEDETNYLIWRDNCEKWSEKKLKLWDQEIEAYGGTDIYFEEDEGKQFVLLTQLINRAQDHLQPETLYKMVGMRYKIKNSLMKKIAPDLIDIVSDLDIEKAREYPLWRLVRLPRPKNIKCPRHDDANPSFQVSRWGFCHTCRYYVDGIGWNMEKHGLTFSASVKDLANR